MPEGLEEIWKRSVAPTNPVTRPTGPASGTATTRPRRIATAFCLTPWWLGTRRRGLLCMGRGPRR
jgi:hypothetical protein